MNYLFCDYGSSGSKILAYYDGFLQAHFVEPGATLISANEDVGAGAFGSGLVEMGGECWKVGHQPMVCHSNEMKKRTAIAKTLAALGSLTGGKAARFKLVLLLPCDEFASRRELAGDLREVIMTAKFNGVPLKVHIEAITINPEGTELLANLSGQQCGVMVGHTDISIIRFENGKPNLTKSKTFGGAGIGAIASSAGIPGNDAWIAQMITKGRETELAKITGLSEESVQLAIAEAHQKYVADILRPCLQSYSWAGLQNYVLSGGGSKYLLKDLSRIIPIRGTTAATPRGMHLFGKLDKSRFADIYGTSYLQLSRTIAQKMEAA